MKKELLNNDRVELQPGVLERWGLKIIELNIRKLSKPKEPVHLSEFFANADKIIKNSSSKSFFIGFIVTIFYVIAYLYIIDKYPSELIDFSDKYFYLRWFWILLALGLFTYIELYAVYRVGLKAVCEMAVYAGFDVSDDPILITKNKNILSRIALEISDHRLVVLGINPEKLLNKKSLLIKTLIYKAKIVASNFLAKLIVRRILARSALRAYSDFIIAPITGFWDGLVTYFTLIKMKKRLFTRILAEELLLEFTKKSKNYDIKFQELCIRSIASAVVLNFQFHPNLEFLLLKFYERFEVIGVEEVPLDDIDYFFEELEKNTEDYIDDIIKLFQFCCAIDGKLTQFERKILKRSPKLSSTESISAIENLCVAINKGNLQESRNIHYK